MNTRFPVGSAHRPLFTGSPNAKASPTEDRQGSSASGIAKTGTDTLELRQDAQEEKPRPGFVTPPTPSTIKTDEETAKDVKGAQDRLKELLAAGVLEQADYDTFNKTLEKSEKTSDDYKEKGRILYSKLYEADEVLAETKNDLYKEIATLKRTNHNLRNSLAANQLGASEKKPTPNASPFLRKSFSRPSSSLRPSTMTQSSSTIPTKEVPDQAGNSKGSERQL